MGQWHGYANFVALRSVRGGAARNPVITRTAARGPEDSSTRSLDFAACYAPLSEKFTRCAGVLSAGNSNRLPISEAADMHFYGTGTKTSYDGNTQVNG